MKKIILLALTAILWQFQHSVKAQDCAQCKSRVVVMYDLDVQAAPEDSTDATAITNYWKLFLIAKGTTDYFMNSDASRNCFVFHDGAFFTQVDSLPPQTGMKFGYTHANLPPSGPISDAVGDYLISGTVTGGAGQYNVTINLETAVSREVVKSVSMPYTFNLEPFDVGRSLGAQLSPLYQTIMDFEKKKRDGGEPWAIMPTIVLTPDKTQLNTNESTNITLVFKDCDEQPLPSRSITTFEISGGQLDKTSVTTDDNGTAIVKFTAGSSATVANVGAQYLYKRAIGASDAANETPAIIQVQKPNDSWYISVVIVKTTHDYQTSKSQYGWSNYENKENYGTIFNAYLKNSTPASLNLSYNFSVDTTMVAGLGTPYDKQTTWGSSHEEFLCAFTKYPTNRVQVI